MRAQRVNGGARRRQEALRLVARLAARQHGVVTTKQLRDLGLSRGQLERQRSNGGMRRLHRGAYLVGPTTPLHAREMAAVLACAPRAALSHRSAACLWQLLPYPAKPALVHVTVAGRNPGRHSGLRVHRTGSLGSDEITMWQGILVTTPGRTLLDLATQATAEELERAIAEAFALRRTSRAKLIALLESKPRRPGARALRSQLDVERAPARTRSPAERRLLTLIRRARLPNPVVNGRLGRWEVDFLWPEQRVAVEVDGFAAHSSPTAFERDHQKTMELQAAGLRVIRASWRQLLHSPDEVIALLAAELRRGATSRSA